MKPSAVSPLPLSSPLLSGSGSRVWELAGDAELARAAALPDGAGRGAFVEIVRRHQTAVCAVAWSVTGRAGLTDDIAQETFFKAWKQIATLRDPAKLKAWLTRIARDCAVDALRREKPHASLDDPAFANLEPSLGTGAAAAAPSAASARCSAPPPDKAAADAEDEALVWSALAALPENLRTPLVLFYREGRSMPSVAAALDLSEEAVRQRLSRGRQALKSAVESRIETTLGRAAPPSPLLVLTIAAGIGALTKPAAVAAVGTVSSAGAAASAPVSGTAAAGGAGFSTFMTASAWLAAALSLAAFFPLGWRVGGAEGGAGSASGGSGDASAEAAVAGRDPFAAFADSPLLAVWRRLHAEHGSDAAAMPAIDAAIEAEPDDFRRRALSIALMSEWAAVDPEGAFQQLLFEKRNPAQFSLMMREWLKRDPDKAAAHLQSHLAGIGPVAADLARDVAELAPEHFIALLMAFPESSTRENLEPGLARGLCLFAERNPQLAMDSLPRLKGELLESARRDIALTVARTDPAAGLRMAREMEAENDRMATGNGVMRMWAKTDPAAALASLDSSAESRRLSWTLLNAAASQDLPAALRLWRENLQKFPDEAPRAFSDAILEQLNRDPAATLSLLESQPADLPSSLLRSLTLTNLRTEDLERLRKWALQQPAEGGRRVLWEQLTLASLDRNPAGAFDQFKQLPPELQTAICAKAGNFASLLSRNQFEELLLTVPSAIRVSLIETSFQQAARDPQPDIALWRQRLEEVPAASRELAASQFAGNLVETDPRLAVSFSDSLPEGPMKVSASSSLMNWWAPIDPVAASVWADQLPPGDVRDAASEVLASRLLNNDVDAAVIWASSIGDPQVRARSLRGLMDQVSANDPPKAAALLHHPQLNAADRELLEKHREERSGFPY